MKDETQPKQGYHYI